jgi:hypothetical protein
VGDQIQENERNEACSKQEDGRGAYKNSVMKPEGKRLLEIPRRRWEDNI